MGCELMGNHTHISTTESHFPSKGGAGSEVRVGREKGQQGLGHNIDSQ